MENVINTLHLSGKVVGTPVVGQRTNSARNFIT